MEAHMSLRTALPCRYCDARGRGTSCTACVYNATARGLQNNFSSSRKNNDDKHPGANGAPKGRRKKRR